MADAVTWTASILTHDAATRRDITSVLVEFHGVARHLKKGEWEAVLAPQVWPQLVDLWPSEPDLPPLLLGVRWVAAAKGVIISGPIRTAALERAADGSSIVRLVGVDEWAWLSGRVVWPQPADLPPWTTDTYHSVTGQASTVVAELIRRQADDLARSERLTPGLTVVDQGAGVTGTWKYRLAGLDLAVEAVAHQAGLTVDVRRTLANAIEVVVGAARDRTSLFLDETKLGDYSLVLSAATATTVIAGGAGDGTSRLFALAGGDVSGVARVETFSDQRNIDSQPTLQRSADASRSAFAASTSLSGRLTAAAAAQYEWRDHYQLGDSISLQIAGNTWPVTVTAVTVTIDDIGLRLEPVLGIKPRHALEQLLRDVTGLADRLNTLEVS